MKQLLCCMLLLYSTAYRADACDACGCSSGNQNIGILPQFYKHFIGFQYQYRSFSSTHPALLETKPDEHSEEYYNTYQLWGRYNVSKRLQLFGFVPYNVNRQLKDDINTYTSGIGDISAWANVVVFKTADSSERNWKHMLMAGGGITAPIGKHDGITILDREGLPNMQAGSGAWDFIANANYTIRYKQAGINTEAAYTFTTADKDNYKYGNRLSLSALGFYWLEAGQFSILPQAGLRYNYTLHDYDNYDRKWLNEQTGGYQFFAVAGVQAYYKRYGMQLNYQLPVAEHYAAGYVHSKQNLTAGLFFLF